MNPVDKQARPGTRITTEKQFTKWVEFFGELLNRPTTEMPLAYHLAITTCRSTTTYQQRQRSGEQLSQNGTEQLSQNEMEKRQDLTTYRRKPWRFIQRQLFKSCTTSSKRSWKKTTFIPEERVKCIRIKMPKKVGLRDWTILLSVPGKILDRTEAVNLKLRYQQVVFKCSRLFDDQIANLCITIVQLLEEKSHLYINFIDYEKAFDSMDRETLWKKMKHHGVAGKFVFLICNNIKG